MKEGSKDRDIVASRLAEDLIGPRAAGEALSARPSDVYLTGILWPQRIAMSGEDDENLGTATASNDEPGEGDAIRTSSIQKPSVAGISFCASSKETPKVRVLCSFATYRLENREEGDVWIREPHHFELASLDLQHGPTREMDLREFSKTAPNVALVVRCIETPRNTLVTLSLVNKLEPEPERNKIEASCLFQTEMRVEPTKDTFLVPKPARQHLSTSYEINGSERSISDEESGALLYRNVWEFAVGHVCSAEWDMLAGSTEEEPRAKWVATTWIPSAILDGVDPNGHHVFSELSNNGSNPDPLSAYDLAHADESALQSTLDKFCSAYKKWIDLQKKRLSDSADIPRDLADIAHSHLSQCDIALKRMSEASRDISTDPRLRRAFQLANLAMHIQHSWDKSKSAKGQLRWRPFQLGFLLLSAPSAVSRSHEHRSVMDLLWFPTGGGKTEAYLALIACLAVHRRLSTDPCDYSGVSALMRYTLRLLTTQQFSRSAAMILALEAIRTGRVESPDGPELQGDDPFSIGLWVGGDATPNKRIDAWAALNTSGDGPSVQQLSKCPACSQRLKWSMQSTTSPVVAECQTANCPLSGSLPVYTVDDDVYEFRPTLLIGTADKFAQIVREKRTNRLFGIAEGSPPDLIIQDELHLISGPLGTIAGIYEAAFDLMFSRNGQKPKIIGSTATIRRASEQVLALFDRDAFQFPPPAIDHDDSGFAVRDTRPEAYGRRYLGVTTSGRSAKFTLQAISGSLLQTASGAFDQKVRKDAYWTLVGYFNSLRELGGALVLMQDDVTDSIKLYADYRSEPQRNVSHVQELTSRRSQAEIGEMLHRLEIKVGEPGAIDTVLATNMVSVGVDISRLGLMLVNGQPKTISEYIQATSRVGRGGVSGIIVSVLNNAKARDRSHFETFCSWHQTLYRDVEATSVTPFASRARDRAIHAALVAVVRHLVPDMLDSPAMNQVAEERALELIDRLAERAERVDPEEPAVRDELQRLLSKWEARSPSVYWSDFKGGKSLLQSAEKAAARRAGGKAAGSAWPTLNSMRSVEAGTPFKMAPGLRAKDSTNEE